MDDDLRSASNSLKESAERPVYAPKPTKKPRRSFKIPMLILAAILVLLGGGFLAWKLLLHKSGPATLATNPVVSELKNLEDVPKAQATETYNSTALSVSFKYPKTWKITEATGGIRIESPWFAYSALDHSIVNGNFRIYIRQGSRTIDGKYIGRGVAIKPSETLTYSQPAPGQRTTTLLSSFGLDTADNFAFFMIAGNFQLNEGDTLGPDYGKEPDAYIIAGGYSTPAAVDDLATTVVPLNYYATTIVYKQAVDIISSLQLK
ncbi:hypothetical protein BH10PAT3_BH10PAT3_6170 [soil metagenome]